MPNDINRKIADTFLTIAEGLEAGTFSRNPRIALTAIGGEHGEAEIMAGAEKAAAAGVEVLYIGTLNSPNVTTIFADCESEAHKKMEELLESSKADAAVTMHYPFPIGVSTVGLSLTPSRGRSMFIATTTGTSATGRAESMLLNTIAGIIAAKACGIKAPTLGILNIDGARQTESALLKLREGGYELSFAESERADGGCVMRGNDVLFGAPDIMVTDSLTGNVLSKMLSSFSSGGNYETCGCGYGPGIGKGFKRVIMILSRASGAPVVTGAIEYAARLLKGSLPEIAEREYKNAEKAGLSKIIDEFRMKSASQEKPKALAAPPSEVVTAQIMGVEISELEDAVGVLWKASVYASSGMGCTGPVIMVSESNYQKALALLKSEGFLPQ